MPSFAQALITASKPMQPSDSDLLNELIHGRLQRDALAHLASNIYAGAYAFPQLLARLYAATPDQGLRGFLLENMIEEEGMVFVDGSWILDPSSRHVNWAVPFLQACGVSVPSYGDVIPLPAFVERELVHGRWHTAIAYVLVGIERNTPFYFSCIADALKKHYGMQDHELNFFYNHIVADAEHGNRAVDLLAKASLDHAEREAALAAVKRGVRAFGKTFSYVLNKTNMTVAC